VLGLLLATVASAHAAPARFTDAERQWIRDNPVVTFTAETRLPPLEDEEDGRYVGLFSGYVEHVSRTSGLTFRYVHTDNWDEAQARFASGEIDLLANAPPDGMHPAVRAEMDLSRPYFASPYILIGRTDAPMSYTLDALKGQVVAIRMRAMSDDVIQAFYPGADILRVASADEALQAVADGRATVASGTMAMYFPRLRRRYVGILSVAGMPDTAPYLARMGVHHKDPLLLSIIDKSIGTLSASQTDALEQQWLGVASDYGAPSFRSILLHRRWEVILFSTLLVLLAGATYVASMARIRARRSEHSKTRFLAMMSHEIRTPINAMVGSIEMLQTTALDARQRDLAESAHVSAEGLMDLLDNVLDLSKVDARRLTLERRPTDIRALLEDAVRVARIRADLKGVQVDLQLDDAAAPVLHLDATRLRQVVANLLGNAVKFTSHGNIHVDAVIERKNGADAPMCLNVAITDTGIGIAPAQLAGLFMPYTQADQSTTREFGGTGLGLTICRELLTLMGGTITLESAPGQGTTARFSVPAEPSERVASVPEAPSSASPATLDSVGEGRVLVVEDHPANQVLIRDQLRSLGVQVGLVDNGYAALDELAVGEFDLVLMDCHMPGMDGYETTRRIRRDMTTVKTPIIAISAATDAAHLEACDTSGMDGVLRKPLRRSDLAGILDLWGVPRQPRSDLADTAVAAPVTNEVQALLVPHLLRDVLQLSVALQAGDLAAAHAWAHRINGAGQMAGHTAMADAAASVEACLREGAMPPAALLTELQQAVIEAAGGIDRDLPRPATRQ